MSTTPNTGSGSTGTTGADNPTNNQARQTTQSGRSKRIHKFKRIPTLLGSHYKKALANLGWRKGTDGSRLVALTSCNGSEGVSTVASQMAICAARHPAKVLLIDANDRNPTQHVTFNADPMIGFFDYIEFGNSLDSLQPTLVPNLWVMPCGSSAIASLEPGKINSALETLQSEFDLVIVDLPAISEEPNTITLAPVLNHLVVVVSQSTSQVLLLNTKRILENAGAKISGIIQNQI